MAAFVARAAAGADAAGSAGAAPGVARAAAGADAAGAAGAAAGVARAAAGSDAASGAPGRPIRQETYLGQPRLLRPSLLLKEKDRRRIWEMRRFV